ncbi:uncharacterized protein DC041_0005854 [Schistosoma bovis]|uniref:Endonuclease/exonuclease/phosphatase domain-containing protein n=1 Tax=Schistosoma bovis TaxID=6184 RepID=A0A430QKQ7_SCHBO|nr:uncharacterized protein DC041_0005854 [Schistosoma bovis]
MTLVAAGPGSDISPHTRNSTRDQVGHIQILPTPNTSLVSMTRPPHVSLSPRTARTNGSSTRNVIPGLLKPRSKLHVGAFNVRTLCQIIKQASLARTLESRAINVCGVSETRIQDPSSVIHLTSPYRDTRRCLFVVSAYSPTDCSSDDVKDEFYRKLSDLLRKAKRSDVVIVAGDFNAQVGKLSDRERHLGGSYGVVAQRTDNGDRLRPPNSHRWRGSIKDCRSFYAASKPLRRLPNDSSHVCDSHPEAAWNDIRKTVETAVISAIANAREMEKAAAIGNSRQLFRLVNETISEKDGHIIHSQSRRLDRWAEHFRDQFNWPSATLRFPTISSQPEWKVNVNPPGVELLPGGSLVDLEYADYTVLFEDAVKIQTFLTTLGNNASMFGIRFSLSKHKILISPCDLVCDEISARIQKARLAFTNLRHLWRRRDIRLSTKGWVYCAAVLVRKRLLGIDSKSIEVVKLHQLRWLGHVLGMPNDRLPRRATCRLPGWDPRDDSNQWL